MHETHDIVTGRLAGVAWRPSSLDAATRNSRSPVDSDRLNQGRHVWSDPQRMTNEINADPEAARRLRESRRQARAGELIWEDSDTE